MAKSLDFINASGYDALTLFKEDSKWSSRWFLDLCYLEIVWMAKTVIFCWYDWVLPLLMLKHLYQQQLMLKRWSSSPSQQTLWNTLYKLSYNQQIFSLKSFNKPDFDHFHTFVLAQLLLHCLNYSLSPSNKSLTEENGLFLYHLPEQLPRMEFQESFYSFCCCSSDWGHF